MTKKVSVNISFGMLPVVAVLAALKVAGVLHITWWWVAFPLILPIVIWLAILGIIGLFAVIVVTLQYLANFNYARFKYLTKERVKKWLKTKSTSR